MKARRVLLLLTVIVVVAVVGVLTRQAMNVHKISQLKESIQQGDRPRTNALIDSDPSLLSADLSDPRRRNRLSPLSLAASLGKYDIAADLVGRGADVQALDLYSRSALHYAVQGGNPAIVQLLIDHHADTKQRMTGSLTALELAEHSGSSKEIKEILKKATER